MVWRSCNWQVDEDVDAVDIEREGSRSDNERRGYRGGTSWGLWPSLEPGADSRFRRSIL